MAKVPTGKDDRPTVDVAISHCGELVQRSRAVTRTSTATTPSDSVDRGRDKRRRSESHPGASSSPRPRLRDERGEERGVPRDLIPPSGMKKQRRRSDHEIDGTLRGRRRQRSCSKGKLPDVFSRDPSSNSNHRRSPSPSRSHARRSDEGSDSRDGSGYEAGFRRRRRSLPNHYDRLRRAGRSDERVVRAEESSDTPRRRRDARSGQARRHDKSERLGDGPSSSEAAGASGGNIVYKGRGSMKYREQNR